MHIPSWPQAGERESELLRSVLESSQWGGFHPFVTEFEESFAAYQHCRYGISAFNGTVTLELALSLLGIGPGDEVIIPAISFISTAAAVSRLGALPVFVDIDRDSYNIDPEAVRAAISPTTKAVIAVHFGGIMCRVDYLQQLCDESEIFLLEDAAHAHGSEWNGKRAGSFGIAGSFSFQNGKALCSGEGGMLVTSDDRFAERARSVVNCGREPGKSFYEHYIMATNLRMTGFQAAVLLAQFERLPDQIQLRHENVRRLTKKLTLGNARVELANGACRGNSEFLVSADWPSPWRPASSRKAHKRAFCGACSLHALLPSNSLPKTRCTARRPAAFFHVQRLKRPSRTRLAAPPRSSGQPGNDRSRRGNNPSIFFVIVSISRAWRVVKQREKNMQNELLQTVAAPDLSEAERSYGLSYLARTRDELIHLVAGLTGVQWNFRPEPEQWSIALVIDHLAVAERLFLERAVPRMLAAPPTANYSDPKELDILILTVEPDRSVRIAVEGRLSLAEAPALVRPSGDRIPAESFEAFLSGRARTIAFLESPPVSLRQHATEHLGFGLLDGYQWILFLAAHTERHIRQIRELRAHSTFPAEEKEP